MSTTEPSCCTWSVGDRTGPERVPASGLKTYFRLYGDGFSGHLAARHRDPSRFGARVHGEPQ